jgi:hypothetical protein
LRGLRSLCAPGEVTDTVRACAVDVRSLTSAPRQRRFSRPNRMSFHARLPRRHVGRTDPIAPCDGDARIVRAVWRCGISLRAIELRGLVFKGTTHARCGITISVIPGERSETRDPGAASVTLRHPLGPGSRLRRVRDDAGRKVCFSPKGDIDPLAPPLLFAMTQGG